MWHHRRSADAFGAELSRRRGRSDDTEATHVWVACEASTVRSIRRLMLDDKHVPAPAWSHVATGESAPPTIPTTITAKIERMTTTASRVALWVGSYTSDMDGSGDGILALGRDADGGYAPLGPATPVASPSFLALHPTAARALRGQRGSGAGPRLPPSTTRACSVRSVEPGTASALVCHVAVSPDGDVSGRSCWGDGSVLLFELEADGSLGGRHAAPASEDPYGEGRQSRAHSCLMLGGGRFVTAEMGHDLLRCWSYGADRGLESRGSVTLAHGCGPRHFARSTAGVVYVNTEYSGEVVMLTEPSSPGRHSGPWLELRGSFPVSAGGCTPRRRGRRDLPRPRRAAPLRRTSAAPT